MSPSSGTLSRVYLNRRMAALLALGFASGLPSASAMLGSTLQAWLGALKYDVTTIGLTRLLTLPVALHFAWAPLLDRYAPPGWFGGLGRRRGWLMLIQLALIAAIVLLAWCGPREPGQTLGPLVVAALWLAFLSASQDTVADAYRTDVLRDEELGAGAAVFVNGYRVAMLLAGGGAMFLSGYLPWPVVYGLMGGLMAVGLLGTWLAPPPPHTPPPLTLREAIVAPARDFFDRKGSAGLAVLLFIVLFKLPDAMGNAMVIPLLQKGLGFDSGVLGARETVALAALVIGALAGGGLEARLGLSRALWLFIFLQALSNAGFLLLAYVGKHTALLMAVSFVESFCAGLATAGFIAFLMAQCNRRYSATQYALFTSLMFAAGNGIGAMTGYMVRSLGYTSFFALTIAAGLPGVLLLAWLSREGGALVAGRNGREEE